MSFLCPKGYFIIYLSAPSARFTQEVSDELEVLPLNRSFIFLFLAVPEIKAVSLTNPPHTRQLTHVLMQILGGYVLDDFLSPWTLLIKAVGLALAVASGLSLGKEV